MLNCLMTFKGSFDETKLIHKLRKNVEFNWSENNNTVLIK